jgi:hypothetical protein
MLKIVGMTLFYFVLIGLVGRFAVDFFVALVKEIGMKPPDPLSEPFVGVIMLLVLIASIALAIITPTGWWDD